MRLEWIVNYNDDTCGCALMGFTGIRLDEKRIAILTGYNEIENARQALTKAKENESLSLRVDRKGQFYAKGVLVPYRDVLSYFQEATDPSDEKHPPTLWINFPVGIDRRSAAVKERVDQLETAAKTSGWEVNIEKKITEPASDLNAGQPENTRNFPSSFKSPPSSFSPNRGCSSTVRAGGS